MKLTRAKFEDVENVYSAIAKNKYSITTDLVQPLGEHAFDLESEISKHQVSDQERFVFGCQANNEYLPFEDETFDCYLANLSLMLVDNYKNQLTEALRVTKKGAKLAFSVWGRREFSHNFSILEDIMTKHGLGPKEKPKKSNFDLGKDPEGMKQELLALGFSNIRIWYQPMNFNYADFEDYFNTIFKQPTAAAVMKELDEATVSKIKEDAKALYEEKMGSKVLDP